MMPNLRYVIAQVNRNSRSIGSHRNFSTSSNPDYEESVARVKCLAWMITRGIGMTLGYGWARHYYSDVISEHEEGLLKDLRERELYLEQREKFYSDMAKS